MTPVRIPDNLLSTSTAFSISCCWKIEVRDWFIENDMQIPDLKLFSWYPDSNKSNFVAMFENEHDAVAFRLRWAEHFEK